MGQHDEGRAAGRATGAASTGSGPFGMVFLVLALGSCAWQAVELSERGLVGFLTWSWSWWWEWILPGIGACAMLYGVFLLILGLLPDTAEPETPPDSGGPSSNRTDLGTRHHGSGPTGGPTPGTT